MPPLGYRRATPSSTNPSGVQRAITDGRAARGTLRSLALLVDRMVTLGVGGEGELNASVASAVRDALRQFTARIREAPMLCRIADGQFVLAGEVVDRGLTRDDPLLGTLLFRCLSLGIGGITVRQGAAPAELLTLATYLARSRPGAKAPAVTDTPTSMSAVADQQPRELLRSWSVLVTPDTLPGGHRLPTPAAGVSAIPDSEMFAFGISDSGAPVSVAVDPVNSDEAHGPALVLARLASAHDDAMAMRVVDTLVQMIDQAETRGDSRGLEFIAIAAVSQLHAVGVGAGRLATERLLRRLQHRSSIELLAKRLPHVQDRMRLIELLSRSGETAVDILVKHLMEVDDAAARRVYFDSIVQLDMAGPALFDLVRDSRWFVVRNAVALLGEMGVQHADMAMLPLLQHNDDRIRIAAARALMRIGTPKALQALHAAIEDRSNEVRRIAAVSYGLTPGTAGMVRPHAARLSLALEKETDEDVALEMLASLGKLGSADAIQRLLRIALPQQQVGDNAEPTREAWLRIAALEALVRARGNAVMPQVEALMNDTDPEVAQAAFRLRG
jgi:HEAT repeat protein